MKKRLAMSRLVMPLIVILMVLTLPAVSLSQNCFNNTAITLETMQPITQHNVWVKTGLEMPVTKVCEATSLFYTCQITFQLNEPAGGHTGVLFRMRVKDSAGNYIMPDMETRKTCYGTFWMDNAMLSDSVFHIPTQSDPPQGQYTFELWALVGRGSLLIVPFQSNIAVLEMPRQFGPIVVNSGPGSDLLDYLNY